MKHIAMMSKNQITLAVMFAITAAIGLLIGYFIIDGGGSKATSGCAGTCVELRKEGAHPDVIAIEKGSYVQFNSADGKSHSLSLGGGGEAHDHYGRFNSGTFGADEAWKVQFNDDGTFRFHDHDNPRINIVVVVYTPGKEYIIE